MHTTDTLRKLAKQYEAREFINGDPSWFMHQVEGKANIEVTAFVASSLSYGSRKQFMSKIQYILDCANKNIYEWIVSDKYTIDIPDNNACYYRLYNHHTMNQFLNALKCLLDEYGSIGEFIKTNSSTGLEAVNAITQWFASHNGGIAIPKDSTSACKRICMFLRWMVRDNSPVDLGLWSEFIDKRSLIIPLDTHVIQEAVALSLLKNKSNSMSNAIKLTNKLSEIFPDDPLKGDFALFGYGVNK